MHQCDVTATAAAAAACESEESMHQWMSQSACVNQLLCHTKKTHTHTDRDCHLSHQHGHAFRQKNATMLRNCT